MHNHQPPLYHCPMCILVQKINTEINSIEHIVYEDSSTLAYVAPKWWVNNSGHVLVVPKVHVENLYDISDELLSAVYATVKKIGVAIRETYDCTGISTRQHNEPDGNQDVWHFHVHVFPRYGNDNLYQNHENKTWVTSEERLVFVTKLKEYFAK